MRNLTLTTMDRLDWPDTTMEAKAEAYRKGAPRSRRGNAPKFNKAKARARVKAARKARRAGR